jgi:hypothetical protein
VCCVLRRAVPKRAEKAVVEPLTQFKAEETQKNMPGKGRYWPRKAVSKKFLDFSKKDRQHFADLNR